MSCKKCGHSSETSIVRVFNNCKTVFSRFSSLFDVNPPYCCINKPVIPAETGHRWYEMRDKATSVSDLLRSNRRYKACSCHLCDKKTTPKKVCMKKIKKSPCKPCNKKIVFCMPESFEESDRCCYSDKERCICKNEVDPCNCSIPPDCPSGSQKDVNVNVELCIDNSKQRQKRSKCKCKGPVCNCKKKKRKKSCKSPPPCQLLPPCQSDPAPSQMVPLCQPLPALPPCLPANPCPSTSPCIPALHCQKSINSHKIKTPCGSVILPCKEVPIACYSRCTKKKRSRSRSKKKKRTCKCNDEKVVLCDDNTQEVLLKLVKHLMDTKAPCMRKKRCKCTQCKYERKMYGVSQHDSMFVPSNVNQSQISHILASQADQTRSVMPLPSSGQVAPPSFMSYQSAVPTRSVVNDQSLIRSSIDARSSYFQPSTSQVVGHNFRTPSGRPSIKGTLSRLGTPPSRNQPSRSAHFSSTVRPSSVPQASRIASRKSTTGTTGAKIVTLNEDSIRRGDIIFENPEPDRQQSFVSAEFKKEAKARRSNSRQQ